MKIMSHADVDEGRVWIQEGSEIVAMANIAQLDLVDAALDTGDYAFVNPVSAREFLMAMTERARAKKRRLN